MPRDVAEVQRELEKIVPVLGSTEEADRIPPPNASHRITNPNKKSWSSPISATTGLEGERPCTPEKASPRLQVASRRGVNSTMMDRSSLCGALRAAALCAQPGGDLTVSAGWEHPQTVAYVLERGPNGSPDSCEISC